MLSELAKEEKTSPGGDKIFYLSAMLELTNFMAPVKAGEMIYPSGIRLPKEDTNRMPESINMPIKKLLEEWA